MNKTINREKKIVSCSPRHGLTSRPLVELILIFEGNIHNSWFVVGRYCYCFSWLTFFYELENGRETIDTKTTSPRRVFMYVYIVILNSNSVFNLGWTWVSDTRGNIMTSDSADLMNHPFEPSLHCGPQMLQNKNDVTCFLWKALFLELCDLNHKKWSAFF